MTKVTSSKKKPKLADKVKVVEHNSSLKPKKMGSEIDEIFAGKKRKNLEKEKKAGAEKGAKVLAATTKSRDRMKRTKSSKSNAFEESSSRSRVQRKTADGLTIYTEEELGFGKPDAGGTPLCPFDCDCCF